jgi:ribosomal protein L23
MLTKLYGLDVKQVNTLNVMGKIKKSFMGSKSIMQNVSVSPIIRRPM